MVSRTQCDAIVDMLTCHAEDVGKMSPDMRSKMVALATSGKWHQDDLATILPLMAAPKHKARGAGSRGPMQKATPTIIHYFLLSEWMEFQDKGVNLAMDYLITRLLQLGYKNVSEPCKAWCASMMLFVAKMYNTPLCVKQRVLNHFKREYHERARRAPSVGRVPLSLPMPDVFLRQCPQLFHMVFPGEKPCPSLIDLTKVDLPDVRPRSKGSDIDIDGLFAMQGPGAPPGQMHIVDKFLTLQQENMKLLQNSVGSHSHVPLSLKALAAPPMASLQDHARTRLALPSSSQGSQETLEGFQQPMQHALLEGQIRALPDGDTVGEPTSHLGEPRCNVGEPTSHLGEPRSDAEPTSPKSLGGLPSAQSPSHDSLEFHKSPVGFLDTQTQSSDSCNWIGGDTKGEYGGNPIDNQLVAIDSSNSPNDVDIQAAPTGLAHQLLGDMLQMEKAKAEATKKQAKQESKAKGKAKGTAKGNAKGKAKGKAKAEATGMVMPICASAKPEEQGMVMPICASAKAEEKGMVIVGTAKALPKADVGTAKAETKGNATVGKKRPCSGISHEQSRKQYRARLPNGTSKSFKYTSQEEMTWARNEAEAYLADSRIQSEAEEYIQAQPGTI